MKPGTLAAAAAAAAAVAVGASAAQSQHTCCWAVVVHVAISNNLCCSMVRLNTCLREEGLNNLEGWLLHNAVAPSHHLLHQRFPP